LFALGAQVRPLIKQGGREFIDKKVFSKWEINPRSITMGTMLGSGMFGGAQSS
jgi:hypothetical protein